MAFRRRGFDRGRGELFGQIESPSSPCIARGLLVVPRFRRNSRQLQGGTLPL